jgi:hypothetical protein
MTSFTHLTEEQLLQMRRDLEQMKLRGEEMVHLLTGEFGQEDKRTARAHELLAAVQRLQWVMESSGEGGAESAAVAIDHT